MAENDPEVREHPLLVVLWLLSLLIFGAFADHPVLASVMGGIGGLAILILVIRVFWYGYSGYEFTVGLRIISRERASRSGRAWLIGCWSVAAVATVVLLVFQFGLAQAAFMDDPQVRPTVDLVRVGLVFLVATASFFGLLLAIAQRFSVFGTTSIFGVVLGVAALVVVQSVATGFQHEFESRVLGVYAHINVTRAYGLPEYRRFESWLRTLDGVEGASPFIYYAMALAPYDEDGEREGDIRLASVLVKGIEPSTADEVIEVAEHLERGSGEPVPLERLHSDMPLMPVLDRADDQLPLTVATVEDPRGEGWYSRAVVAYEEAGGAELTNPSRGLVVESDEDWTDVPQTKAVEALDPAAMPTMFVGKTLADELKLGVGDVVRLVDPGATFDHSERPRFRYYSVAGVFEAGFQEYDSRLVYVDVKELSYFKYRGRDVVSGVDLRLTEPGLASVVGAEIRRELGDEYTVLEWQKLNENLFSSIRTQKNFITILLSVVIFAASFNVLSALWTIVLRRTPDVAILMSMGATRQQVARVFQVTGMVIGVAGSVAGVIYGLVICGLVQLYGYTLDPEVYFIERLPVEISATQIGAVLGLALGICFIATTPPALQAAWLRPVDGLRYE